MYDHIGFHANQDGLPEAAAAAVCHMAAYYTWAVAANLHSQAAANLPEFAAWQQGKMTADVFVLQALNGGLDASCFNEEGQRFTEYYYVDEEEGYGHFISDYFVALGLQSRADFYRQTYSETLQNQLNPTLQVAFERWQATRKTPA